MPTFRKVDLHEQLNPDCRKCSRPDRIENTDNGLCDCARSVADGGRVRCVGDWANQKLHFLTQYVGIFGPGMNAKWEGHVQYVEICSGPGRCVIRDSGIEMDGSPLAVLQHSAFPSFETATFLDYEPAVVAALNARINRLNLGRKALAVEADYNTAGPIIRTLRQRFSKGLSLVFIDPTDCSVPFGTVAQIAQDLGPVDFIINMAVRTDANRNIKRAILNADSDSRAKYIRFLGGEEFFLDPDVQNLAALGRDATLRAKFREHYSNRLRQIGYQHLDFQPVAHYYDLLFASRHDQGLAFWNRAQKNRYDGQRTFEL